MFNKRQVTISTVASELGFSLNREQLRKVGATVAQLYRRRYEKAPEVEYLMLRDAQDTRVNLYSEKDRDLIVAALNSWQRINS